MSSVYDNQWGKPLNSHKKEGDLDKKYNQALLFYVKGSYQIRYNSSIFIPDMNYKFAFASVKKIVPLSF